MVLLLIKKTTNNFLSGEKYILYVRIKNRGIEKFTVNVTTYYDYEIGNDIIVTIEE